MKPVQSALSKVGLSAAVLIIVFRAHALFQAPRTGRVRLRPAKAWRGRSCSWRRISAGCC